MIVDNLEIEIRNFQGEGKGYSFFSENNGKKRTYLVYLPELRQKLRELVSPFGIVGKGNIQFEGNSSHGDRILYSQGSADSPDQLILISEGSVGKQEEITGGTGQQQIEKSKRELE
jgi:hypothetical protein